MHTGSQPGNLSLHSTAHLQLSELPSQFDNSHRTPHQQLHNMASQGPPPASGGGAAAGSPQALNQIVIEYLSKKGYSKTEAMLRVESAHTDHEGRPILSSLDDQPELKYEKSYCEFV